MDLAQNKSPLVPHEPLVPGGMKYCSEKAQKSVHTQLELGEVPKELLRATSLFSIRERFKIMQRYLVSDDHRARAACVSIFCPYPEMFPVLIESINDSSSLVREKTAGALGHSGKAEAVRPLLYLLGDEIETVCMTAAAALGELGSLASSALPVLKEAAAQKKQYAVDAYARISNAAAASVNLTETPALSHESMPPPGSATEKFERFESNIQSDAHLSRATSNFLLKVVEENLPPSSVIAVSLLGARGEPEFLVPIVDMLSRIGENSGHHLGAIATILKSNPDLSFPPQLQAALEPILFDTSAPNISLIDRAVSILMSHHSDVSLKLFFRALFEGSNDAREWIEQKVYRLRFDSDSAQIGLHVFEQCRARNHALADESQVKQQVKYLQQFLDEVQ